MGLSKRREMKKPRVLRSGAFDTDSRHAFGTPERFSGYMDSVSLNSIEVSRGCKFQSSRPADREQDSCFTHWYLGRVLN